MRRLRLQEQQSWTRILRLLSLRSCSQKVPEDCRAVLAPSALTARRLGRLCPARPGARSSGGTGRRGDSVARPDVQYEYRRSDGVDLGLRAALHDYFWSAQETGGFYEGGGAVVSVLPGIGMTANGLCCQQHHLLPALRAAVDEAGLTRARSPLAGSHTHYHNYTFFLQRPVTAGQEIFVNYGPDWFAEREGKLQKPPNAASDSRRRRQQQPSAAVAFRRLVAPARALPGPFATHLTVGIGPRRRGDARFGRGPRRGARARPAAPARVAGVDQQHDDDDNAAATTPTAPQLLFGTPRFVAPAVPVRSHGQVSVRVRAFA